MFQAHHIALRFQTVWGISFNYRTLMAALYGKGVDNLLIEMNSEEVPILDGSSKNLLKQLV